MNLGPDHLALGRSTAFLVAAALTALAGCGRHAAPEPPSQTSVQVEVSRHGESDDAAVVGLSALSRAADGSLWAVPERQDHLLRLGIEDGKIAAKILPLRGKPAGLDAEGLAMWGAGQFAIATEGHGGDRESDAVLLGHLTAEAAQIDERLEIPYSRWGIRGESNRGLEGLCWAGRLWVAAETVISDERGRWAPLARREDDGRWSVARLRLTSQRAKISALACRKLEGGETELWAIERHYGTARWLRAVVPPQLPAEITASVHADLAKPLAAVYGQVPNVEGIAADPEDPAAAWLITDNSQGGAVVVPAALVRVQPRRDGAHP